MREGERWWRNELWHKGMNATAERPGRREEEDGWVYAPVFIFEGLNQSSVPSSWPYTTP
jgi:hypothetical protein